MSLEFSGSVRAATLVSCALALSACASAVSLIQLDNEWARTYTARLETERANPDFLVSMTSSASFDAQLADLSARAEREGDAALAKDPPMAVGFYRVAAAAAWKSGTARETQVLPISDKGIRACESLPKKDASQPRDCAFIRLVPELASLDVKMREINGLRTAGPQIPADKFSRTVAVTGEVTSLMGQVLSVSAAAVSPPKSFSDYVAINLNAEFCNLQGLTGRFASSNPPPEQKAQMSDLVNAAEQKLQAAGVSTTCN